MKAMPGRITVSGLLLATLFQTGVSKRVFHPRSPSCSERMSL
jgi:hypothetical protein